MFFCFEEGITSKAAKQRRRAKKGLPKEQNCHPAEQIVGFGGPPAAQTGHAWFSVGPSENSPNYNQHGSHADRYVQFRVEDKGITCSFTQSLSIFV